MQSWLLTDSCERKSGVCWRHLKAREGAGKRDALNVVFFYSFYRDIPNLKLERAAITTESKVNKKVTKDFIPLRVNKHLRFDRRCPL